MTASASATVQDQTMYERQNQISVGVKYPLVNGASRHGELDTKVFSTPPVRRSVNFRKFFM
jgi:hypothetical protein